MVSVLASSAAYRELEPDRVKPKTILFGPTIYRKERRFTEKNRKE